MAPLPLCLPVMLSVIALNQVHQPPTEESGVAQETKQQPEKSSEVMSVYLPRYNSRCEPDSEGTLCYDPVLQNFMKCISGIWSKVYIDKQVPILMPQDTRDIAISRLTAEISSLKSELSSARSDLLRKLSSPWCEEGWKLHGFECYYNSLTRQEIVVWQTARQYCQDRNSTLVTIENEIENEFISGEVGDAVSWIGLRIGTDGTRKWVDSHLGSGYHNLAGKVEDNACVYIDGGTGEWRAGNCDEHKTFLCQRNCCGVP